MRLTQRELRLVCQTCLGEKVRRIVYVEKREMDAAAARAAERAAVRALLSPEELKAKAAKDVRDLYG